MNELKDAAFVACFNVYMKISVSNLRDLDEATVKCWHVGQKIGKHNKTELLKAKTAAREAVVDSGIYKEEGSQLWQ